MTVWSRCDSVNPPPPGERIELVLNHLAGIPTLPAVATQLLAVTASDGSSTRDLVEIIESDAALTAEVLRLVRETDPGRPGEAVTVAQAVTLWGFGALRNAVLSIQLYETLSNPGDDQRVAATRKEIWRHSLAVACAADMIGQCVEGPDAGSDAFVCGLFHDIGKVALDRCLPKSYARVVERAKRQHACICDIERETFGLDHTVAGKHLVLRWGLPQPIIECVWLHHQHPDALPSWVACRKLVHVVHLADNLVRRGGIGYSGYRPVSDLEEPINRFGMEPSELDRVLERLPERMTRLCHLLGLDDLRDRGEYSRSIVAANKQFGQLNETLAQSRRRLEVRSACYRALERFTKQLCDHDGIGEVCVAAARTLRTMLGAESAVAFFRDPTSRCIYVGCADDGSDGDHAVLLIDPGDSRETIDWAQMPPAPPARGLVPAPEDFEVIWRRCNRICPREPLWMLPVVAADGLIAAVLILAAENAVGRFRSAPGECEALSAAIGLALTSTKARVQAERMSEELVDLNRRLYAARKELAETRSISMIAATAAGAAHELNNPLTVISGRAQMELAKSVDEDTARAMRIIIEQTQRATQIVTDLMHFAKPAPSVPVSQPLEAVLEPLCQHWRTRSSLHDALLTFSPVDRAVRVYADQKQLREILHAVIANALEAVNPETGRVQINSPSHPSDERVRIVVQDNGIGMIQEVLEHAIDPFFSSRSGGRGRGLGLSLAYRLAEVNGGRLWLESKLKLGTTVTIELPARVPGS